MKAARLLFLSQWFDPEPAPKGLEFAKELTLLGFDVEVVTGFPNYPGGKVYEGYRVRLLQREEIDGVKITRVPLYPSHSQSRIGRVLNYLSFMISALIYVIFMSKRPDVVYVYHPPLTVGIVAAALKLAKRVPFVLDVQDLWPHTLQATRMVKSIAVLKLVAIACRWVYASAGKIAVLSPGFKAKLLQEGVPESKLHVIFNWARETALTSNLGDVPKALLNKCNFNCVFAGTMGRAQGLEVLLEAALILRAECPKIQFFLVGGGVEAKTLKDLAASLNLNNVTFLPAVPMESVGVVLRAADLLLVLLRDDPLFAITLPSKTQAYMAIGKPILMAVAGDAADLIAKADCGFAVAPGDARQIANAIKKVSSLSYSERLRLGNNGKKYYEEMLSFKTGVEQFERLFLSQCRSEKSG